ncbi:alpha-amylase family protein [Candidatus Cyrtobacter comes]|nr:hypothetical protein [Candidatus Cyrtobacter comes]
MTLQLEEVSKLGFDTVWTNPLYKTGEQYKKNYTKGELAKNALPTNKKGSLYAMNASLDMNKSEDFLNSDFTDGTEKTHTALLKEYTARAVELGITPIFDLVLKHVAIDSKLCEEKPNWFDRHKTTNEFKIRGISEDGFATKDYPWDDVASFNYNDPEIRDEIIEQFWKPFIFKQIAVHGFRGARLDAAGMMPKAVYDELNDYIKTTVKRFHNADAIIFAETFGNLELVTSYIGELSDNDVTHVTNSLHWVQTKIGPNISSSSDDYLDVWNKEDGFANKDMGIKQQMTHLNRGRGFGDNSRKVINSTQRVGTIGFVSSHDEEPWALRLQKNIEENEWIKDPNEVTKGMREKIAVVAFGSDGGWYITCGDEYATQKQKNVFDSKKEEQLLWKYDGALQYQEEIHSDLTEYIKSVNSALQSLEKVNKGGLGEWKERIEIDGKPDLVIFVCHKMNYDGNSYIMVANINPEKQLELTKDDMKEIASKSKNPEKTLLAADNNMIFFADDKLSISSSQKRDHHLDKPKHAVKMR